jgi:outer membrane protein assembly factor BamB
MGFASYRAGGRPGRPRLAVIVIGVMVCAATTSCASGPGGGSATTPPPITILTHGADNDNGDIFIAPEGGGYANGPEILTTTGHVVWFHPLPNGEEATDFRTQTYLGQPVLTWFQGAGSGGGTDEIYNDRYQPIATVTAAHGYMTNFHEFLITPWNTALILADTITTANLTSIGGPSDQQVIDGIVQEIDIKTGQVLFQWDSADHVPYRDSEMPVPGSASLPWDWFHINAVHLDTDGNLLIDARNTWTTYKVNIHTGQIIWELGGKQSSFTLKAAPGQVLNRDGKIFAWQHDPEAIGGGEYTVFDDESGGALLGYSRVVTVRLDLQTHVATLIKSDNQPEGLIAGAMGNAQTTRNGDLFVGWGALPYISEFSPSGKLLFNAELPNGITTYRAYRLPWSRGV